VRGWLGRFIAAGLVAASWPPAGAAGIYACVDAKGRRITSDRPILDCLDREQTELGPTGQVIRKIGPSLTAAERAAEEEKARRALEERNRQLEEKRRDRALLTRYPDKATHDRERSKALATVDDIINTANRRTSELQWQRKKLDNDLEFYDRDMKKVPATLKRQIDENDQLQAAQKRFIANQEDEKKRINSRFDEELTRLKGLWAQHASAVAPTPAASRR
jgi:hypothetical protein